MRDDGKQMDEIKLLLNWYYETLYNRLQSGRGLLAARIEKLLRNEITKLGCKNFDQEKYAAYRQACLAFIDERIEAYNPVGFQYTFDRISSPEAVELELQLNWYDSSAEWQGLLEAVQQKTQAGITEDGLQQLADELIQQYGAFPDNSIISAYEAVPALNKLPDYIVARLIEDIIR
jgi:hypothetical protein